MSVERSGPWRVLLASGRDDSRRVLAAGLTAAGCETLEAVDGPGALRALRQGLADAAVLDASLENLTGLGVVREVRRTDRLVVLLVLDAAPSSEAAVEFLRHGADDYLPASAAPEAVLRALERAWACLAPEGDEHLWQARKMEALGQLASGVAHDLNNLLTALAGQVQTLLDHTGADARLHEGLEEVQCLGERSVLLARQLLALGRKQGPTPLLLNPNAILAGLDQLLQRLAGAGIEFRLALGLGLGRIRAAPGQLEQVVLNLVLNARDAMPQGGRLWVETALAGLDEAAARHHLGVPPGTYVRLTVRDTGQGMDEATQAHLFEPFFTTKGQGTGLGLSTIWQGVRRQGGAVRVASQPGQGTTVTVYWPQAEPAPAPAVLVPRGGETVLLVDDFEPVRSVVREVLRRQGYTVVEARDGEEALRLAESHAGPLHLVLTDLLLPRLDGRQVAQRLRAKRPGLKVLFISGQVEGPWTPSGDRGTAFLPKPFAPDVLARTVRELLDA